MKGPHSPDNHVYFFHFVAVLRGEIGEGRERVLGSSDDFLSTPSSIQFTAGERVLEGRS